ncbi:MAG: ComEA family DNA-binding protein [Butyrivibrio sp.]|nr:ComEA family DNA-binding protein [Butyrivibrio sp.]
MHKYTKILFGLAAACAALACLFYMLRRFGGGDGASVAVSVFKTSGAYEASDAVGVLTEAERETAEVICVYVCGAVASPGIYYLEEGARIAQAVEAAGGTLPDADLSAVNPASRACDSQKIYIPSVGESAALAAPPDTSDSSTGGPININTADAALLSTLPGIGKVKAESIVAYREENGGFKKIEDIMNVSGIKDSAYEKIKDLICI